MKALTFYIKYKPYIGLVIGLASLILAWICFSWKLSIVIFLALWGNNIQQSVNYGDKNEQKFRAMPPLGRRSKYD